MPTIVDEAGRRVALGERVGPRGGEGELFRVVGDPTLVVKVYHQPADRQQAEKLNRLRELATASLKAIAALPLPGGILFDASNRGRVTGFVMPFRPGRRVERLYSPRDRLKDYPKAGWDFLLHVARNCAAAFETLHEHGILMADVNEGNVLVADNGLVRLIDCDSYQVIGAGGRPLTCDVGVPLWTPPELQGRSLFGVVRTSDHDRFGLAVLIFHLLFMGRHPYAGVPVSKVNDDLQLDAAIAQDRFAYGANHLALGVRPPPHLLTLAALPSAVGNLFERAFGPHRAATPAASRGRPTGREWADVLGAISIRRCTSNPLHAFPESARDCPWCHIYRAGGIHYFAVIVASGGANAVQIEELWRLIAQKPPAALVVRTLSAYQIPAITPLPAPFGLHPTNEGFGAWLLLVLFGSNPSNSAYQHERMQRLAAADHVAAELNRTLEAARSVVDDYQRHFAAERGKLEVLYRRHQNLATERNDELRKLELRKREIQFENFLDSHLLARSTIEGIGPNRKRVLKGFGIETALDININLRVPGIGPTSLRALIEWRQRLQARFVFNPAAALPAGEIAKVDQRLRDIGLNLEARLRSGPVELDRLAGHARQALERVESHVTELVRAHAQAIVDYQQLPEPPLPTQVETRVLRTTITSVLGGVLFLCLVGLINSNQPGTVSPPPSRSYIPPTRSAAPPNVAPAPLTNAFTPAPNESAQFPNRTNENANRIQIQPTESPPVATAPTPIPWRFTPSAPTPRTESPMPVLRAEALGYKVIGVSSNDMLNVRSGPGASYPLVGRLHSTAKGIQVVGTPQMNGPDAWVSIQFGERTGWVLQRFLAPE